MESKGRAEAIIADHVIYSMLAAAIPVPVADIAAVTAVQLDMVRGLAEHYSIKYEVERGKAIVLSLAGASAALERGDILILFPEGSRGEPEQLDAFKTGVAHLAKRYPAAAVTPVFLHGLGKALPRGTWLLVPFFCDVFVGEALAWTGERASFMAALEQRTAALAAEGHFPAWD